MPGNLSPGHGQRDEGVPPSGDSPRNGRPRHAPDEPGAGNGSPPPSLEQPTAGGSGSGLTPGDLDGARGLDGDCWDQEAALAAFMADLESGLDLFSSGIGLEPDEEDWPPEEADGPPSSDIGAVAMPGGDQAGGDLAGGDLAGGVGGARPGPAAVVPECLDAGFCRAGDPGRGRVRATAGSRRGMCWIPPCRARWSRAWWTRPPGRAGAMRAWMMMN